MMNPAQAIDTATKSLSTGELARALGLDEGCNAIASVDRGRVVAVAAHLRQTGLGRTTQPAAWDDPLFWNVDAPAADRSQFLAVGNAINFRFWRLDAGKMVPAVGMIAGERYRGSMYMWRSLRRALDVDELPVLDPAFLSRLTSAEFDAIFSDDHGVNPLSVASDERLANLRDLGTRLVSDWNGLFLELVLACEGSLLEFARFSSSIRAFDDPLVKLTMVNAIMHSGSGIYEFRDDPIPGLDYHLLKQALRQGLIVCQPQIALKLTDGDLLSSEEAAGLRRAALAALVELSTRVGVSGEVIDNVYWRNRTNCTDDAPVCLRDEDAGRCPFVQACGRAIEIRTPLELTRYY